MQRASTPGSAASVSLGGLAATGGLSPVREDDATQGDLTGSHDAGQDDTRGSKATARTAVGTGDAGASEVAAPVEAAKGDKPAKASKPAPSKKDFDHILRWVPPPHPGARGCTPKRRSSSGDAPKDTAAKDAGAGADKGETPVPAATPGFIVPSPSSPVISFKVRKGRRGSRSSATAAGTGAATTAAKPTATQEEDAASKPVVAADSGDSEVVFNLGARKRSGSSGSSSGAGKHRTRSSRSRSSAVAGRGTPMTTVASGSVPCTPNRGFGDKPTVALSAPMSAPQPSPACTTATASTAVVGGGSSTHASSSSSGSSNLFLVRVVAVCRCGCVCLPWLCVAVAAWLHGYHASPLRERVYRSQVNGHRYIRLGRVGRGGTSTVYKVLRESDGAVYALKRVDLRSTSAGSVANELRLLESLQGHPHVIKLVEHQHTPTHVFMVMELGETDLSSLLQRERRDTGLGAAKAASAGGGVVVPVIDLTLLRWVWQGMLRAVDSIHQQRIVHGDLKPANFVLVKGVLKIIDFGIADAICGDTTNIHRESQVGTVNYMAPEAIGQSAVGRASDIWSLGCILYEMVFGRKPFAHLRGNPINKLLAIANPATRISFKELEARVLDDAVEASQAEADLLDVLKACLNRNASQRPPISTKDGCTGLLQHAFLVPPRSKTLQAPGSAGSAGTGTGTGCGCCGTTDGGRDVAHFTRGQLSALLRQLSAHRSFSFADDAALEGAVGVLMAAAASGGGDHGEVPDLGAFLTVSRTPRRSRRSSSSSAASSASSSARRSSSHRTKRKSPCPDDAGSVVDASGSSGGASGSAGKAAGATVFTAAALVAAKARLQPGKHKKRRCGDAGSGNGAGGGGGDGGGASTSKGNGSTNKMTMALRQRLARIRRATAPRGDDDTIGDGSDDSEYDTL